MAEVDLSIIIISWNVKMFLIECLRSVLKTSKRLSIEIVVVDNASTDSTANVIRQEFPEVKLIVSPKNLGFPKANNLALKYVNGKYILFLNPDTIVDPGTIEAMVKILDERDDVGMVGCQVLKPDGTVQFDCAREFPTLLNAVLDIYGLSKIFPRHRFFARLKKGYWDHKDSRDVACILGACMIVKRTVLQEVGYYLDDRVPMYFEDIDLCYRVGQSAYKIHYLASHTIVHYQGESSVISKNTALLDMLDVGSFYLFILLHNGGEWRATFFRWLLLGASILRLAVFGLLTTMKVSLRGHSFNTQRDIVRARAWWRFAWKDYKLAEAGTLTFQD